MSNKVTAKEITNAKLQHDIPITGYANGAKEKELTYNAGLKQYNIAVYKEGVRQSLESFRYSYQAVFAYNKINL